MGTTTLPQIKVSEGTKRFAERIYAAAHEGKLPSEMIEEERRHAEAELKRAQEAATRQLEETILRMSQQLALPTAQIATALDVSIEVVEEVLLRQLGE